MKLEIERARRFLLGGRVLPAKERRGAGGCAGDCGCPYPAGPGGLCRHHRDMVDPENRDLLKRFGQESRRRR